MISMYLFLLKICSKKEDNLISGFANPNNIFLCVAIYRRKENCYDNLYEDKSYMMRYALIYYDIF